ncbi:hypothetical protein EV421DRAFT_1910929 [Armillaria borealis]|uniref:Transmembrane protein n=1 Tax=Armillaria borealis TaxID=47425 RepID=A0AA39MFZ8_9AGAR|nr:hypothetical protein EV421DRAFT_1910929 [Armillaria borealis]
MDHHDEERVDLLTTSVSNDDLSLPPPSTSLEAGFSSSSATLLESTPTAQWIRLGGTPVVIAGLLFVATLGAVLHHLYLFILQGRAVSGQFWIKNSSNALSTFVQWLCMGSVSLSLTQLIWWLLRRRPFTILQLNHIFSLPDPLRTLRLASSRRLRNALPVIILATLSQTFALVSILAPNSLEVGSASPESRNISVPTTFFNKTDIFGYDCTANASSQVRKVLSRAFQSDTLIGWSAPAGCGTACNYTVQYAAPALRCTELDMEEVSTMLSNQDAQGIQDMDDLIVYNATWQSYMAVGPISVAWRIDDSGNTSAELNSPIAGTRCFLYNTTQQSTVSFVNNSRMISPRIISYDSPIDVDIEAIVDACPAQLLSINGTSTPLYTYAVMARWVMAQLTGSIARVSFLHGDESPPFRNDPPSFDLVSSNLFSINDSAVTFAPSSGNVSSALEQILLNATVAIIASWGDTTIVTASVVQDQLVWVYHEQRLWIIYATALGLTAVCGAVGVACILKDGNDRDLTFWDIVRVTRNPELDAIIEGEKSGNVIKDTMLQYDAVQGQDSNANTSGIFVLAMPLHKGLN